MNYRNANIFIFFLIFFAYSEISGQTIKEEKDAYLKNRLSLIQNDSLRSFEADIILSPKEKELDQKLRKLQRSMLDEYKDQHFFPPARNFYNSKEHIRQTKLFSILRKMPKGGILHVHHAAGGDADWFVDKLLSLPEAHIYWGPSNDSYIKGQMSAFNKGKAPEGFQSTQILQKEVPNFRDSLHSMITFDESLDADSVDIWLHFEAVFQRIYSILGYRPFMKEYLQASVDSLVADGIQHVEFRMGLSKLRYYDLAHPEGFPLDSFFTDIRRIIDSTRKKEPAFNLKIIQAHLRFFDRENVWANIRETFELKARYPELIKGYDLVAEEDAGNTTLYFIDNWLRLDSLESAHGIELPLYLHDGESDWVSTENMYDAVLLKSRRIGHGFNLFRFPSLIEAVKKQDICIEVSPLSNQILGYIRDLRMHPASYVTKQGVQITISSDDPLIFDYVGLTYDFWSVFMAWELDLRGLKKLCRNSLEYSTLEGQEKEKAIESWERKWEEFVGEALENF